MHTKEKGNIGEAIVLAEFVKRNIQVAIPFGDNARYDLIAEFGGKLNKIQIKYCSEMQNDSVVCKCASSTNHTTNKRYASYQDDVDYICCYLQPWDTVVIIPIADVGNKKNFNLRLTTPKNNQQVNVHYVENYTFDKILKNV